MEKESRLSQITKRVFEQQDHVLAVDEGEAVSTAIAYAKWLSVYTGVGKKSETEAAEAIAALASIMVHTARQSHRNMQEQRAKKESPL
jgi:hypothetical protein